MKMVRMPEKWKNKIHLNQCLFRFREKGTDINKLINTCTFINGKDGDSCIKFLPSIFYENGFGNFQ